MHLLSTASLNPLRLLDHYLLPDITLVSLLGAGDKVKAFCKHHLCLGMFTSINILLLYTKKSGIFKTRSLPHPIHISVLNLFLCLLERANGPSSELK